MPYTQEETAAAVQVVAAIGDTIKALGEVPSGHLYAALCGLMPLDSYSSAIRLLKANGLVTEENHLLTWVGQV